MKLGLREAVFFAVLLAIPVGTWWFVFRPRNASNAEMLEEIESKQAKLRQLNSVTATIGDLKEEIASLEKAVVFFQSKLPNEKEIDRVLREVWHLAESNRLATKSIRTEVRSGENSFTDPDGPHGEQPIRMRLEGNFRGFYAFLLALENLPRIMRIHKMTLKKLSKGPEGHMHAEFVMSIFFERNRRKST